MKLKDKFTFKYEGQQIEVQKTGDLHSAIFKRTDGPPIAKPLKIELFEDNTHKGKISTWEGKFLSFLPADALEGTEQKRQTNTDLIKMNNLPLFCEICLNDDKTVLEVHHIKEHAITANDNKDNLRVYCSSCHSLVHNLRTVSRRITRKFNPNLSKEDFDNEMNKQ
jgi:hypothetical protein